MDRFEYIIKSINWVGYGNISNIETQLKQLGNEGWELVQIYHENFMILKKKLMEETNG
jgi:hypothetical protein